MLRRLFYTLTASLFLAACPSVFAEDAHWIDVRTPDEYNARHVSPALNIPYGEIARRINEVTQDRGALIYVYCRSGRRSGIAKTTLDEMGFTRVVNLGGFEQARQTAVEVGVCPEAGSSDC